MIQEENSSREREATEDSVAVLLWTSLGAAGEIYGHLIFEFSAPKHHRGAPKRDPNFNNKTHTTSWFHRHLGNIFFLFMSTFSSYAQLFLWPQGGFTATAAGAGDLKCQIQLQQGDELFLSVLITDSGTQIAATVSSAKIHAYGL